MIIITNSQRDYMLKFIALFCKAIKGRAYNTKTANDIRMAEKLRKQLEAKHPLTVSDICSMMEKLSPKSDYNEIV